MKSALSRGKLGPFFLCPLPAKRKHFSKAPPPQIPSHVSLTRFRSPSHVSGKNRARKRFAGLTSSGAEEMARAQLSGYCKGKRRGPQALCPLCVQFLVTGGHFLFTDRKTKAPEVRASWVSYVLIFPRRRSLTNAPKSLLHSGPGISALDPLHCTLGGKVQ